MQPFNLIRNRTPDEPQCDKIFTRSDNRVDYLHLINLKNQKRGANPFMPLIMPALFYSDLSFGY